ncbi:hypothetical protein WMY93_024648 [Mugilogobius chulae]|uniref:RING-type domain-containing protein n=1 Tax=Mugilogobius chulae TaxID=88201 RepID=A0AAW0N184_9GOBI
MSLRLLPAITMDGDEDDDGNFTKWMSSYWGHGAESGQSRDRKRSFRRPARSHVDRRGSLPTVSQSHESREDCLEVRPHPRARRCTSDDSTRPKTAIPEARIGTIPEITTSLETRLRTISLNDDNRLCLICYEAMQKNGLGTKELHCTHRFHKECMEQWLWRKQTCPTCRACVSMAKPLLWTSSRTSVP